MKRALFLIFIISCISCNRRDLSFITLPPLQEKYLSFVNEVEIIPHKKDINITVFCFSDQDSIIHFRFVASSAQIGKNGHASVFEVDSAPKKSITVVYSVDQYPVSDFFNLKALRLKTYHLSNSSGPQTPVFYKRENYIYNPKTAHFQSIGF